MEAQEQYQQLLRLGKEIQHLKGISYLLDWDQETYMPLGAAAARAEQAELMAKLIHQASTRPQFVQALSKLIDIESGKLYAQNLSKREQTALQRWRRDYLQTARLPEDFVETFAKITSEASHVWSIAKKNNDFLLFEPYLEQIVSLCRKRADLLGYKEHPYDALLDEYEPEATQSEIETLFSSLKPSIIHLVATIQKSHPFAETPALNMRVSEGKQMNFAQRLLKALDYDLSHGRLDLSSHPFSTSMHPSDSRITTRIETHGFLHNLSATLHEAGHAFYEMGLPQDQFGSPLAQAVSLGIHESQSRWWETRIGLSKPFWVYFYPKLQRAFGGPLKELPLDNFYQAINQVTPSLIRIHADEVTYTLHVILRFELECALIEGTLKVKDLPDAWNAKMKEFLGLSVPSHAEGCLQDIHWSKGYFGYFPTYSLGNLYASHFFESFAKQHPDWEERVARGSFQFIREWLGKEIHQYGREYTGKELAYRVTGKELSSKAFIDYLNKKYDYANH